MKRIFFTLLSAALVSLSTYASAGSPVNPVVSKKTHHLRTDLVKAKASSPAKKMYSMAELSKNLEYDFGKASIRAIYYDKLDQLAKTMIANKNALALRGYADSIGTFKGNWVISDRRAKVVKDYLIKKGVDGDKIVTTPFGSTKPIASNKTKSGRQKNRRVEIKLNEVSQ